MWHTLPPPLPNVSLNIDLRDDDALERDVPLFRQVLDNQNYAWIRQKLERQLPRLLGSWKSPYYGFNELLIARDYREVYPESAPTSLACQLTRLLTVNDIEDALISLGKDADAFFSKDGKKISSGKEIQMPYTPLYGVNRAPVHARVTPDGRVIGDPVHQYGVHHEEGLAIDTMACCGQILGKTPGCWIALDESQPFGEIRPYRVWFSNTDAIFKGLAEETIDIQQTILNDYQIGTAFRDKAFHLKLHKEIQSLLAILSRELAPVYAKLVTYLDERIDDSNLPLFDPFNAIAPGTRSHLQRLLNLLSLFNEPQKSCVCIETIKDVFSLHLASKYFRPETRNFVQVPGVGRIRLLKTNQVDSAEHVDEIYQAGIASQEASRLLLQLIQAIRDIPDVRAAESYASRYAQIEDEMIRNRLTKPPSFDALKEYNQQLINVQRRLNLNLRSRGDLNGVSVPSPAPHFDVDSQDELLLNQAYNYTRALKLPINVKSVVISDEIRNNVLRPLERRKVLEKTASVATVNIYKKQYEKVSTQYRKWLRYSAHLLNMPSSPNVFVDEFRTRIESLKTRMLKNTVEKDNESIEKTVGTAELDLLKTKVLTAIFAHRMQDAIKLVTELPAAEYQSFSTTLLLFEEFAPLMTDADWELVATFFMNPSRNYKTEIDAALARLSVPVEGPLLLNPQKSQEALNRYPEKAEQIISPANFLYDSLSCPYDTMFPVLFKIPGLWLEKQIRRATEVYSMKREECRSKVDDLHREVLADIFYVQSPGTDIRTICRTRAFWGDCFFSDRGGRFEEDDPRGMTLALLNFYQLMDNVQIIQGTAEELAANFTGKEAVEDGKEMLFIFAIETNLNQLGKRAFNVPLKIKNYNLMSIYSYKIGHYDAYVRDPIREEWWNFDARANVHKIVGKDLPRGENGKGPLGWVYVKTLPLAPAAPAVPPPPPPPSSSETVIVQSGDGADASLPVSRNPIAGEFPVTFENLQEKLDTFMDTVFSISETSIEVRFAEQKESQLKPENKGIFEWLRVGLYLEEITSPIGNVVLKFKPPTQLIGRKGVERNDNFFQLRALFYGVEQFIKFAASANRTDAMLNDIRSCIMIGRVFTEPRRETPAIFSKPTSQGGSGLFSSTVPASRRDAPPSDTPDTEEEEWA